ncbi:MAG: YHS domain-containing (seleno)protein [Cyclobacteriaceae bacterium]|jgi:YHS domain-containing protein
MKRLLFLPLILMFFWSKAQMPEVYSTEKGAIDGYDPVAFFKEQKPVQGKKEFATTWSDAVWYFASKENRDAFIADPEKFAPQYGGYCAYGTAAGHKSPTQADTWTIVNNKLYFNYNKDVWVRWNKDQSNLIEKANKIWPTLKKQ